MFNSNCAGDLPRSYVLTPKTRDESKRVDKSFIQVLFFLVRSRRTISFPLPIICSPTGFPIPTATHECWGWNGDSRAFPFHNENLPFSGDEVLMRKWSGAFWRRAIRSVASHDARSAWKTNYVVIWSTKRPCGHVVIQTLLFSAQVHPPLINQRKLSGVHLEMLESIDEY